MRLLKFDNLITPTIIRTLFYALVALYCLVALITILGLLFGSSYSHINPLIGCIGVVLGLLFAITVARIGAEMVLVLFMIRDELAWQRVNGSASSSTGVT